MKLPRHLILFAGCLSLGAAAAQSPSFDCRGASTPQEKAICGSSTLSKLDRAVASAYAQDKVVLSPDSFALVQADERKYLHELGTECLPAAGATDVSDCLQRQMQTRVDELRTYDLGGGSVLFYRESARQNAGYLVSRPTAQAATWLSTLRKKLLAYNAHDRAELAEAKKTVQGDATRLEASTETRLVAANRQLICVTFTQDESMGGAHGGAEIDSWNYLISEGRDLTAADIFLPASKWKAVLTAQAVRALQRQADAGQINDLNSGEQLTHGVAGALDPKSWLPTAEGLQSQSQEYEVAAYAGGAPTVVIPWTALASVLQPQWHPETLPRQIDVP